jgi:hypothetical protein
VVPGEERQVVPERRERRGKRALTRWFFATLFFGVSSIATACPLCLGAFRSSVAQQLVDLPYAVLAQPSADGRDYRVVAVIKGERPAGGIVAAEAIEIDDVVPATATLLLVRDEGWSMWMGVGAVAAEHAGWLREIAAGKHPSDMNADEWRAHVALMLPHLEDREPLVAKIAYGELAAAPYAALLAAKPRLDAPAIRRWLADPQLMARQPLYLLLLGIGGDASDAAVLEQRLEALWMTRDATNLASTIAADLQLRGPSRMAWVDARYMGDRLRSTRELEAALLALSVLGNANGPIPRERVIKSYGLFMQEHKELAGFVAWDLAAWQYWGAVPVYLALIKSNARQNFASRVAIFAYLRQSPVGNLIESDVSEINAPDQPTSVERPSIPVLPQ